MKKTRWFYYTVIVGALPFLIRCFVLLYIQGTTWDMFFNPIDFVFFGLTLNLTNINEVNSLNPAKEKVQSFREHCSWWSTLAILFLAINIGVLYLKDKVSIDLLRDSALTITSIALCLVSLAYSFYIVSKLTTIQ